MMIHHLDVTNHERLEFQEFQLLTPAHGRIIDRSTKITCDGKVKALLLKADATYKPIRSTSYEAALRNL